MRQQVAEQREEGRDALVAAIRAQAGAEPETAWVRVQGIDLMGPGRGITRHDLDAAGLDRPVIVAYLMMAVLIFVTINLVVDLLYTWLDPRVRLIGEPS